MERSIDRFHDADAQTDGRVIPIERERRRVCVVGLGYTGLPTAAVLASRGYMVRGVETDRKTVGATNCGRAHITEPDLDMLVSAAVSTGRLRADVEPCPADVFILCVPTPCNPDHSPNLDSISAAARSIAPHLAPGNLVVLESTCPPGTTGRLAEMLFEKTSISRGELFVAHAPERVLPGHILREVVENDRVIGGIDEASTRACGEFYRHFVTGALHLTTARTAEMVKLVENAYRDVNIAFANEVSVIAEEIGLDVWEVIDLANQHPRVRMLRPGPGVGGHCIAVDPWFLAHVAPRSTHLIRAARAVNDAKPAWVVQRVLQCAERFERPCIACLGLTYKPNVGDLRESPALEIARALRRAAIGELRVVEPQLRHHEEFELWDVDAALDGADVAVLLVAHDCFKKIRPEELRETVLMDFCGIFR